jgi:hypothetical protein
MNIEVEYRDSWEGFFVSWPHDEEEQNKEIRKWCNLTFKNDWHDGIDDLHYLVLTKERDVMLFLLRWSGA